jgi:hypothetical protein
MKPTERKEKPTERRGGAFMRMENNGMEMSMKMDPLENSPS